MTDTTPPSAGATPESIARWMLSRLEEKGSLDQHDAVTEIDRRFGEKFTYTNDNGNPAINRRILKAFRMITGDSVIWDRWDFSWRKRQPGDAPSRRQE